MKILLISPTLNGIGGIAQHVRDLINFLEEHGHQVDIITSENILTIPIKKLKNPTTLLNATMNSALNSMWSSTKRYNPTNKLSERLSWAQKTLILTAILIPNYQSYHYWKYNLCKNKNGIQNVPMMPTVYDPNTFMPIKRLNMIGVKKQFFINLLRRK